MRSVLVPRPPETLCAGPGRWVIRTRGAGQSLGGRARVGGLLVKRMLRRAAGGAAAAAQWVPTPLPSPRCAAAAAAAAVAATQKRLPNHWASHGNGGRAMGTIRSSTTAAAAPATAGCAAQRWIVNEPTRAEAPRLADC